MCLLPSAQLLFSSAELPDPLVAHMVRNSEVIKETVASVSQIWRAAIIPEEIRRRIRFGQSQQELGRQVQILSPIQRMAWLKKDDVSIILNFICSIRNPSCQALVFYYICRSLIETKGANKGDQVREMIRDIPNIRAIFHVVCTDLIGVIDLSQVVEIISRIENQELRRDVLFEICKVLGIIKNEGDGKGKNAKEMRKEGLDYICKMLRGYGQNSQALEIEKLKMLFDLCKQLGLSHAARKVQRYFQRNTSLLI